MEVIDFTLNKTIILGTLIASTISLLLYLTQPSPEQFSEIGCDEIVGYEAPWIHPRELMKRQAHLLDSAN